MSDAEDALYRLRMRLIRKSAHVFDHGVPGARLFRRSVRRGYLEGLETAQQYIDEELAKLKEDKREGS